MAKSNAPVFQIKITLRDTNPEIWRRILISSETKLSQLHDIIQAAMGWQNSHGHMFTVGSVRFTTPYEPAMLVELTAVDARQVRLVHLVAPFRPYTGDFQFAMDYDYDFGDGWSHELIFEDVRDADRTRILPACIAGERACPPEDVGGVFGYEAFVEAIRNPDDPEHAAMTEWIGRPFDPDHFDLDATNDALRRLK